MGGAHCKPTLGTGGVGRAARGERTDLVPVGGVERIDHGGPDDPAGRNRLVIGHPASSATFLLAPYLAD